MDLNAGADEKYGRLKPYCDLQTKKKLSGFFDLSLSSPNFCSDEAIWLRDMYEV